MNTGTGDSQVESILSSEKDSDFELFMNEDIKLEVQKANQKVDVSHSNMLGTVKYSQYEQKLFSVQALDKNLLCHSNQSNDNQLHLRRRITLDAIKKQRKAETLIDMSLYDKNMKKMASKISSLLFYRILYSEMHVPAPTKGALMFNQNIFLPQRKKVKTSNEFGVLTTFPTFQYVTATEDHFLNSENMKSGEDVDQNCFKRLNQVFSPSQISPRILEKYSHIQNEIKSFIKEVFGELHLALECFLISLIYLEKLITNAKIELRVSNWKPLLLTSIILATKYWEDICFWNFDFQEF